ncbi:3-hydroxyisobutyrate dehydrogenase [Bordetella genomosp. 10]|uniref:3-hydroxyisobutyrate dehydrogenase n=1 Tax=Bordetella genomosp. 10 TaxID=1416804 RepID=A0A261SAV0_9BORD|nr:NAD(P)-dependent oxidoreductase [Bordetella genomosp. 10]OZI34211.1 3-hydroxyisobutyrate dehydrogenase [Bordetella genomosp. 10]
MKSIGVIGLGNMGRGMALTLGRGGFAVTGTDASAAARASVAAEGVKTVDTIGEVVQAADIVILSLPTAAIVAEVVAGPGGIIANAKPGLLVIDTSTSHPETTRRLAAQLEAAGMRMMDAPVSGGPKGAREGTMAMVIGASDEDLARAMPVLEAMSGKRVHVGGVGAGHVAKIANNLFTASHLIVAAEITRMAARAGVPTEALLQGINAGSGRSFVTEHSFPTWIMNGKFDSGFTMKLMRKDVRLGQELIGALGLDLPLSAKVAELWAGSAQTIADDEDFNRIVELGNR